MLDRANFPFGWACPAGHVDEGEEPREAMIREVKEETGLEVLKYKQILNEFIEWNECAKGVRGHDWYVFEVSEWRGELKTDQKEAKDIAWIDPTDLKNLNLEPVWEHWFKKLKYI